MQKKITGNLIDIHRRTIYGAEITVNNGYIESIKESGGTYDRFIMPGFVDSHVHIESSMATPEEFGKAIVQHGTVATLSDPHEIANVAGIAGIEAMIASAEHSPAKIFFGAPSCVPATPFESAGATLDENDVDTLLAKDNIWFLSEMMNYPGVLNNDPAVMAKINAAKKYNKPVDGHAPGLARIDAEKYAGAGISTDHETYCLQNAIDKIDAGMKIQIREGSAAKNFLELIPLLREFPDNIMFCSDDLHPDDLIKGHINLLVKKAINMGYDLFDVIRAATINPIQHYNIPVGMLKEGDPADFIITENLNDFEPTETWVNGKKIFPLIASKTEAIKNNSSISVNAFNAKPITLNDLEVEGKQGDKIRVIGAEDASLLTKEIIATAKIHDNKIIPDTDNDILKIVVHNRYSPVKPAVAFITGFGLKQGAIASSIAHDSHNIIAIGTNDQDIVAAINAIIKHQGGLCSALDNKVEYFLPLPFGGLMANLPVNEVASLFTKNNQMAKKMGSQLNNPFITASFMALLVIPQLKISDKGLFNGEQFCFSSLIFKN